MTTIVLAAVAPWAVAQGADPIWPQYQGGPGHAGALEDGPQPPFRTRWTFGAPAGEALSAPVIAGDLAIAVGSEAVYGIDVATGEERSIAARSGGPLSAPAVARVGQIQAVLYLEGPQEPEASASASGTASGSTSPSPSASPDGEAVGPGEVDGSSSFLVAVSLRDGTELWRVPLQAVARSGVTVDDTTAYVGDQQGHVVAVALADGSVTWTAEVPGRVDVPVAVSGGTVYVVARDADAPAVAIAALDAATGERSWQVFPRATSTFGSAPAAGVGFVLVGSADRLVRSIAAEDGTERWTSLVLSFFSPATAPAFAGDAVYAADLSGGLYRIDAADGHRVWSHQLNEIVLRSAPVVSGPTVLLGLNDGRLVAFDSESGHLVWESEATPGLVGAIALGSDVVIAVKGGRDGGLIAFEHDPEGELLDLAPPTELETGTTLSRYGLAAAIVLIVALIPGIALRRRLGPPNLSGDQADPGEDLGDEDAEGGQP